MTGFTRRDKMLGALIVVAAVLFVGSLFFGASNTQPVMAAVITPVAQTARGDSRIAEFMDTRVLTEDTRVCFDLADYETLDVQYSVDTTGPNATTVTMQQTNIDPTSGPFNSGVVIATVPATPADANAMTQTAAFGRWNCAFVDVTDSTPITFTIIGVAK